MSETFSTMQETSGATRAISTTDPAPPRLISVIIANYNYARFLEECINSVLSQDYANVEIIVVDDGSTDDSVSVIERFGDHVRLVLRGNCGQMAAMNTGFEVSNGELVVFLDSDDYLLPGALSAHANALSKGGSVRSQGYMTVVDIDGMPTGARVPRQSAPQGDLGPPLLEYGPGVYISSPQSANAWTREFLLRVLPLPEDLPKAGGDAFLMDAAPVFGEIVTIDARLAAYRRHGDGLSDAAATFTIDNITRICNYYQRRAACLERLAGGLPRRDLWVARNWRVNTLLHLEARLARRGAPPPFFLHIKAGMSARVGPLKKLSLVLLIAAICLSPLPLALRLAQRAIHLRYM